MKLSKKNVYMLLPVCMAACFTLFFSRMLMGTELDGYNVKMVLITNGLILSAMAVTTGVCILRKYPLFSVIAAVGILFTVGAVYQGLFGSTGYLTHSLVSMTAMAFGFWMIHYRSDFGDQEFCILTGCILALLLLNLIFGASTRSDTDSTLWISVGSFTFQPGEFIRVLLILQAAMSYRKKNRVLVYSICAMLASAFLICAHDFGGAALILVLYVVMVYALLDNRILTLGLILVGVGSFFLLMKLNPYTMERLLSTGQALTKANTQQGAIIKAVFFSGVGGLGLENSSVVTGIYSAQSDLALGGIQAVFGLPVLVITILAYGILVIQSGTNKSVFPSGHLLPAQLGIMTCAQVLLNYCGSLDLLPFTGVTAPIISRGGSSMLTFGLLVGMCCGSICPSLKQKTLCPGMLHHILRHLWIPSVTAIAAAVLTVILSAAMITPTYSALGEVVVALSDETSEVAVTEEQAIDVAVYASSESFLSDISQSLELNYTGQQMDAMVTVYYVGSGRITVETIGENDQNCMDITNKMLARLKSYLPIERVQLAVPIRTGHRILYNAALAAIPAFLMTAFLMGCLYQRKFHKEGLL